MSVSAHDRPRGEVTVAERSFTMAGAEGAQSRLGGLDPDRKPAYAVVPPLNGRSIRAVLRAIANSEEPLA